MSDAAVKKGTEDAIQPTPLCLLFGQGQQYFLERLSTVPNESVPRRDKSGKKVAVPSPERSLAATLFEPWRRTDHLTSSFRWDPAEDVRQALMAGDPTDSTYKPGTEHQANRVAAIGLAVLTVAPQRRAGRVRSSVIG